MSWRQSLSLVTSRHSPARRFHLPGNRRQDVVGLKAGDRQRQDAQGVEKPPNHRNLQLQIGRHLVAVDLVLVVDLVAKRRSRPRRTRRSDSRPRALRSGPAGRARSPAPRRPAGRSARSSPAGRERPGRSANANRRHRRSFPSGRRHRLAGNRPMLFVGAGKALCLRLVVKTGKRGLVADRGHAAVRDSRGSGQRPSYRLPAQATTERKSLGKAGRFTRNSRKRTGFLIR